MKRAVDIVFIAHGSKSFGAGHLSRCSKISNYIKAKTKNEVSMLFLGHYDSWGEKAAKENRLQYINLVSENNTKELEKHLFKLNPKIIINDNWVLNPPEYYLMLKKYSNYLIVIDDSLHAQHFCDVLINVDPNKYIPKPKRKDLIFFQGLKYLVLPYQTDTFHYDITGDILIFLGGTDYREIAVELAKNLADLMKDKKITVIDTPQKGLPKNVTLVEPFTYPITSLLKFHNIIITSGGTAMLESIYFKKPTFAFAAQPWEKVNIKYFEERSLVKCIGSYEYYPKYLAENFMKFLSSPLDFAFNKNLIDGMGVVRIGAVVLDKLSRVSHKNS
ncbi:MAG: hypothetical protein UU12_C0015G0005 [Candidatus Woesebacteria bacterium GW2011_GWA2_40_7b]|uniref:Pseudaminic acid biosynthesis-associated protein PseG n=1 Tax=Candidatus Woesebacteria bacterium GW2011_GWA2_40_7b TaxID=1618563 RepID=A0A0G0T1F3_9BACT|nr:MAG: hypothetical protein UU12_C0015G0005 [Candidatus Woesebacteria bacterium GW2011_GWA2_40_7b]